MFFLCKNENTREGVFLPPQVCSGDTTLAGTSPSSLPPQVPPGPHHLPTMPRSQQDRALSWGSASSTFFSPLVPTCSDVPPPPPPTQQPPPPKRAPVLKTRGSSCQVSMALKQLPAGTSPETCRRSSPSCRTQTPPTAREAPQQAPLWVPPAPKFRCDPTSIPKHRSEREVKEQRQVSLLHLS